MICFLRFFFCEGFVEWCFDFLEVWVLLCMDLVFFLRGVCFCWVFVWFDMRDELLLYELFWVVCVGDMVYFWVECFFLVGVLVLFLGKVCVKVLWFGFEVVVVC